MSRPIPFQINTLVTHQGRLYFVPHNFPGDPKQTDTTEAAFRCGPCYNTKQRARLARRGRSNRSRATRSSCAVKVTHPHSTKDSDHCRSYIYIYTRSRHERPDTANKTKSYHTPFQKSQDNIKNASHASPSSDGNCQEAKPDAYAAAHTYYVDAGNNERVCLAELHVIDTL